MLACPNTKAATGALEEEVELPNMPPGADVAGTLEVEALLFKKLNTDFTAPGSAVVFVGVPNVKVAFVGCSDSFSDGFAILKLKVDFEELSSLVCSEFPKENTG